jgi:transposase-like protein
MVSVAEKIGCSAQTLNAWVKNAEVDSGKRTGVPAEQPRGIGTSRSPMALACFHADADRTGRRCHEPLTEAIH